ncbi:sensor histidine kinase [Halorubrum trueperi]|uniref:histidine kinase n=1 Tax=Halorubrum trueperi TaxID=2004704 RepID=A0ABD5UMG4_9EURY
MEERPGIAYRRPTGDPTRFIVEAAGESRLRAEALPRSDWLQFVAEADRNRLREALDDRTVDVTYRLTIDGEPTWVHERGSRDGDGDVVGYLFPAGERVKRRRALEQQHERLEEFASVVSHDLRNPLSVAVGNIDLARELDEEAADERLDRAADALGWMDDLISDLLALAREGRSVEETASVDLRSVVDQAWRTVGDAADAALVIDEPLPRVECDRSRLRQALENLFRNAIEHGTDDRTAGDRDGGGEIPPGTFVPADRGGERTGRDARTPSGDGSPRTGSSSADPAVRVFVGSRPDGFYVADDGSGIGPSERESVFEPGHTTADDGTGFGLAIVERIVEAHGWRVSVTQSRAGGARFDFDDVDVADPEIGTETIDSVPGDDAGRDTDDHTGRGPGHHADLDASDHADLDAKDHADRDPGSPTSE